MTKIAYFDCFSGISGDMILGALVDLGVPIDVLRDGLGELPLKGYSISAKREMRGAIAGTRVAVEVAPHGHHRHFEDIRSLIVSSGLSDSVKEKSVAVFDRLARAESRVHQVPVSDVHFHEVGAVDSIVDIVGSLIALEHLAIDRVFSSPVPLGRGFVHTHHGILPVPAPATVLLLTGIPVYDNGVERELVTPTGAAVVATVAESFGAVPDMVLTGTGYGVGSHPASDPPNLLRVLVGNPGPTLHTRRLLMVETHIDDMNAEIYDYIMEELFRVGALDVSLVSMQMKKNRPAVLLRVLAEPAARQPVLAVLFRETTTLGVRIQDVERVELPREVRTVDTPYGACRVKWAEGPDGDVRVTPEYEDCKRLARENRVPIRKVYEEATHCGNPTQQDRARSLDP